MIDGGTEVPGGEKRVSVVCELIILQMGAVIKRIRLTVTANIPDLKY